MLQNPPGGARRILFVLTLMAVAIAGGAATVSLIGAYDARAWVEPSALRTIPDAMVLLGTCILVGATLLAAYQRAQRK